jgi:flagellar basal-body rod protein FlgB
MDTISPRIPAHDPLEFGATAIRLLTQRHELLGANLVNADTPHFKARDMDFASELNKQLSGAVSNSAVNILTTHRNHIGGALSSDPQPMALYRIPIQPSVDGNTVDPDIERGHFMKNAWMTEGALGFLSSTIRTRLSAITGQPS